MAHISETPSVQHGVQHSVTLRVNWVSVLALLFVAGMIANAVWSYDADAPRQSAIYQYAPKTWVSAL